MSVFVPGAQWDAQNFRWNMPDPQEVVRHYKSAAAKVKFRRIEAELEAEEDVDEESIQAAFVAATNAVPIYRGYDKVTMSYFMRQAKRAQRKTQEVAETGIEVSEDELER